MYIFCERRTPRVEYIFKIFFKFLYQIEYSIVDDIQQFKSSTGVKLIYGPKIDETAVHISPDKYLFESDITAFEPTCSVTEEIIRLFPQNGPSDLSYDPFAAAFYMISRHEEYLEFTPDQHGRFPAASSIASRKGFLKKAVVHRWANNVVDLLQQKFADLSIAQPAFQFTPTFDIDNAYAFKNKNVFRTAGGLVKSLLTNAKEIPFKINVIMGSAKDPFDTYDYILETNLSFNVRPVFFILIGKYNKYDKNISPKSPHLAAIIKKLSMAGKIGIHPSYRSNSSLEILKNELNNLNTSAKISIQDSRQHFIKLRFPETYRRLLHVGIGNDYSMGFPEEAGFRAGISIPYPFYDLENEKETTLMIHPFSFMEATYMYYKDGSKEVALQDLKIIIDEVKNARGHFYSIWHNESLSDRNEWKGWKDVFREMYLTATK